ncbi:tyramine oxidase [Lacisediminihabitans profunda]|uniref:Tyramine oxidase n=1 Tax=Lacisediminihabitans profunda TaxID=2594790 RepID=A0A5C8USL7_9MICO|nr:tyramine oxidase [Lacisediminihabitans profunda]
MTVAIAAPHRAAIDSARQAVLDGGTAIDAAIAAAVALTVVYPHQCSLGGDLVALVRRGGHTRAVVSVGSAPAAIDVARLATESRMPRQGPDTVTVPGVVAGWLALAELGAVLPLAAAFERAATLADGGTVVSAGLARAIEERRENVLADPGLAEIFTSDGEPLTEGMALPQPALAATLRTLAADPSAMYTGAPAEAIAARIGSLGGSLSPADFAAHRAETTDAVSAEISGTTWFVAPPPTQGLVLFGVLPAALTEAVWSGEEADSDATQRLLAAFVAAADSRQRNLGDPRGGPIDETALLGDSLGEATGAFPRPGHALGDTVAITVQDSDGTVVSLIQSVYQWFGSGILDPATGIVLHNRGSAFSTDPRHPARVGGGLRPPHTLCPLIGDSPELTVAFGCQGGSAQPWILAQVASALMDRHSDPVEVLGRPRWVIGSQDLGHSVLTVVAEPGCEVAVAAGRAQGIAVDRRDGFIDEAGHVQVVRRVPGSLDFDAASDPRADGSVAIVRVPRGLAEFTPQGES